MSWTKREPTTDLVILGDDEGCIRKIGGLLVGMAQDQQYPQRSNYRITKKDGDTVTLAGSASLSRQIFPHDVGKFIACEFLGWGKSPNGKFKQIEVRIWDGEPTEDMKAWPGYREFHAPKPGANSAGAPASFDDFAAGDTDADDDLPF